MPSDSERATLGSRHRALFWVLMLLGAAVRLVPFAARPSLYLDEAMLAFNIGLRAPLELAGPLDLEQSAPILFLWLEWAASRLLGMSEYALRLTPFLAGLALPPLTWVLVRRRLEPGQALLALGLAAVSPLAVWYANVAKPYAVDATVGTLLVILALDVFERPREGRPWTRLAIACLVAPFLSAPSIFLLGGVLLAVFVRAGAYRQRGIGVRWLVAAVALAAAFLANFLWFQQGLQEQAYLQRFYDRAFLWPLDPTLPGRLSALVSGMVQYFYFGRAVTIPSAALVAALGVGVLGAARWVWRQGVPAALLIGAPLLAVVVAGVLRIYPPVERLLLFLTPIFVLATVEGVATLASLAPGRWRARSLAILSALLLFPAVVTVVRNSVQPHSEGAEVRPVIAEYLSSRLSGDPVYVYSRGLPIWMFYTTNWAEPHLGRLDSALSLARAIGPNSGNAPSRHAPVRDEGLGYTLDAGDHIEVVGVASGIEMLYGRTDRRTPDPGWATNEVMRLRAVASDRAWLFLTHHNTAVENELTAALQEAGARIQTDRTDWAVRLLLVRFPRAQAAPN